MKIFRHALFAALLVGGAALGSGSASAMPMSGLATAPQNLSDVQDVRWVCGRFRCWWQPNFYGPRRYGWYRPGWRHWRRW